MKSAKIAVSVWMEKSVECCQLHKKKGKWCLNNRKTETSNVYVLLIFHNMWQFQLTFSLIEITFFFYFVVRWTYTTIGYRHYYGFTRHKLILGANPPLKWDCKEFVNGSRWCVCVCVLIGDRPNHDGTWHNQCAPTWSPVVVVQFIWCLSCIYPQWRNIEVETTSDSNMQHVKLKLTTPPSPPSAAAYTCIMSAMSNVGNVEMETMFIDVLAIVISRWPVVSNHWLVHSGQLATDHHHSCSHITNVSNMERNVMSLTYIPSTSSSKCIVITIIVWSNVNRESGRNVITINRHQQTLEH